MKLQTSGNDFASRLSAIVSALREDDTSQNLIAKVTLVREGDHGLESRFFWHMIEDSASFNGGTFSYEDFVSFVNSGGQGGPPGGQSRVRREYFGDGPIICQHLFHLTNLFFVCNNVRVLPGVRSLQ